LGDHLVVDRGIMVDHEGPIKGPANVQFDAIDAERHRGSERPERVLTLDQVHSTVRVDGNHRTSLAEANANYMDVISFIRESALVIMFQIR
jgi:hypothetical protein